MRFFAILLVAVSSFAAFPSAASAASDTVTCSFYSPKYDGRRTASGQRFNSNALTAASKTLPFGTRLRLTNPRNHRSVVVRVNDRGPYVKGRDISITNAAARRLGIVHAGVAELQMETLDEPHTR
jgi:rare lipoprotein A